MFSGFTEQQQTRSLYMHLFRCHVKKEEYRYTSRNSASDTVRPRFLFSWRVQHLLGISKCRNYVIRQLKYHLQILSKVLPQANVRCLIYIHRGLEQWVLPHCTELLEVVQKINPFWLLMQGPSPADANISLRDRIKGRVLGHPSYYKTGFSDLRWDGSFSHRVTRAWSCSHGAVTSSKEKLKETNLKHFPIYAFSWNTRTRNIGVRSSHYVLCE